MEAVMTLTHSHSNVGMQNYINAAHQERKTYMHTVRNIPFSYKVNLLHGPVAAPDLDVATAQEANQHGL